MKVAAMGEIMLRLSTEKGKLLRNANNFNANYGGGEANVLLSLSKFGIDTSFISKVSNDDIGEAIISYLKGNDVDTENVLKSDHRTGIYYLQVGSGNRPSKVIYDRANSAFCNITRDDFNIEKVLKDVDVFHFSGIALALSEEVRSLILDMLKYCKENNILVSYDSNYRSKLWSLDEASEATFKVLPYVNILSAGILDAENILKMYCNIDDEYEKLVHYYKAIINNYPNIEHIFSSIRESKSSTVNTLQCNYYTKGKLYPSKIYEIDDIVDRVGGGDALTAGILYSIINEKEPIYTTEFATASSVLKHSIWGDANFVSIEEVENLMNYGVGKILR